jgi:hypothetical protein
MRPRTPSFIWIPFVFSIGAFSWALLVASLALFATLIVGPAVRDMKKVEAQRNDIQATVDLLDQKIALQKQFVEAAATDPLLMQRLASRQFHLERPDQKVLFVESDSVNRDRSIARLLADSLTPVSPKPVSAMPWWLEASMNRAVRPMLMALAVTGLVLAFLLGVKFERRAGL